MATQSFPPELGEFVAQQFRDDVQQGIEQLERGEFNQYNEQGLRERFEQLKDRVRKRIDAHRENRLFFVFVGLALPFALGLLLTACNKAESEKAAPQEDGKAAVSPPAHQKQAKPSRTDAADDAGEAGRPKRRPHAGLVAGLGALIKGATGDVQQKAKQMKMLVEIQELDLALKAYNEKFGEYPPDGTDPDAVKRHLRRAFPRYQGELPEQYAKLDPATALVFWLGGTRDERGMLNGFSANPVNPFDNSQSRVGPFFEFETKRLRNDNGLLCYLPPNDNQDSQPYVYFRAKPNGEYAGAWKNCKPCRDSRVGPNAFANSKTFQIRCPGRDGRFGSGVKFPGGEDYDQFQRDDLSNFCDRTFGEGIPKAGATEGEER